MERNIQLEDTIGDVEGILTKASYIIQEVTENYFDKYRSDDTEQHFDIAYDFNRRGAFASIVEDYIHQARTAIIKAKTKE